MIWALVIFAATLIGKLNFDAYLHFSKKTIKHSGEAVIVFICLSVASLIASDWKLLQAGFYLLGFLFVFWASFDPIFGIIIAKDPRYLGETAKLDKIQRRYPWVVWAKYIGAGVSILFFIFRNQMEFIS